MSSRHPAFVFEPVLNLNVLELAGIVTVVVMMTALKHGLFKALSGFAMHTQAWCPKHMHA